METERNRRRLGRPVTAERSQPRIDLLEWLEPDAVKTPLPTHP